MLDDFLHKWLNVIITNQKLRISSHQFGDIAWVG